MEPLLNFQASGNYNFLSTPQTPLQTEKEKPTFLLIL